MTRRVLVAAIVVAFSWTATASAAQVKIGFIDPRKAIFSSADGKAAEKSFNAMLEKKQNEIRPQRDELQKLEEDFEKQKYVLSESALQGRSLDLARKRRDYERNLKEVEEDMQIEQIKLLQPVQERIKDVVAEIGKEKGISLIVDKSMVGVLYFDDSLDLTDLVIEKLNESH